MNDLTGRQVEVVTVETVYRGVLIEMGESEIYLQSADGWLVVPVDKVVDVRAAS